LNNYHLLSKIFIKPMLQRYTSKINILTAILLHAK
jgi:hypothetical protein